MNTKVMRTDKAAKEQLKMRETMLGEELLNVYLSF